MVRELGNFSTRQGGDRRSGRVEAYAELILNAVTATPDITLAELQAMLKDEGLTAALPQYGAFSSAEKGYCQYVFKTFFAYEAAWRHSPLCPYLSSIKLALKFQLNSFVSRVR